MCSVKPKLVLSVWTAIWIDTLVITDLQSKESLITAKIVSYLLFYRAKKLDYINASIAAKCLRACLPSCNLIDQSSGRMGLALACVVRILHDDWSIRLGENRLHMVLKHLATML